MLEIFIANRRSSTSFRHAAGPMELGRTLTDGPTQRRIDDPRVSGLQLRIQEQPGRKLKVENLSARVPIRLADEMSIQPGTVELLQLPTRLKIAETLIDIGSAADNTVDASSLRTISPPLSRREVWSKLDLEDKSGNPSPEKLAEWFERVVKVQRAVACSEEFYNEIARAAVDLIGLDRGIVLLRQDEEWTVAADFSSANAIEHHYSRTTLELVRRERRTFYQDIDAQLHTESLHGVTSVVASPISNSDDSEVVGVVYGAKLFRPASGKVAIQPWHAQLLQVLAAAAGAGMARQKGEAEAARRHVQFEQFFSKELAGELDSNPQLLEGQIREVTILCSDIRGFSRLSERLGPRQTFRVMNDVLERLTTQIHELGGSVVDYAGDGIMAMWNAPITQEDHAERACRAALKMLDELPGLNETWQSKTESKLTLGIGINTGEAMVGNTGSLRRLKYGPLGNNVNLASRVEGATKSLGVSILITDSTQAKLNDSLATRRLCQVRVLGIDKPVELFELKHSSPDEDWIKARDAYEAALALYQAGSLSEACIELFPLIRKPAGTTLDTPTLTLIARAVEALRSGVEFDPIIKLDTK